MRTRCLLPGTSTNSRTTHQVGILIGTGSISLPCRHTPEDDTNGTNKDGTSDTHTNTDDNILRIARETRIAVFGFCV